MTGLAAVAVGTAAVAAGPAGDAGTSGSGLQTASFAATDDTYVSYSAPNRVNGERGRLTGTSTTGDVKTIYLSFDVAKVPGSVVDAELVLTRDEHHLPPLVTAWEVADTSWDEETLTAAAAPAVGRALAEFSTTRQTMTVHLDVTSTVTAPGRYSFAVTTPSTDDVARFRSNEFGQAAPQLVVNYRPSGTPVPSASASTPPPPPVTPSTPAAPPTSSPPPTDSSTTSPPATPTPTSGPPSPTTACTVNAILVPRCGVWWGVAPGAFTDVPREQAHRNFEQLTGRKVDVFHAYHRGDELFPTRAEADLARERGRERVLFLNWKAADGYTWRQVADGRADARIDRLAAHIKSTFPEKFFLTVHHEPENDVVPAAGSGMTAADYSAMFRHVVQRLRAQGVGNIVSVMSYMGWPQWNVQPWFPQLYPGDEVVDWIAWDPYAWGRPLGQYGSWDFAGLVDNDNGLAGFDGMYDWLNKHHPTKPLMLGEWGVYEYSENMSQSRKHLFYDTVAAQLDRYPRLKGLVYFDTPYDQIGRDTSVDSSPASLTAYQRLSRDPRFFVQWN